MKYQNLIEFPTEERAIKIASQTLPIGQVMVIYGVGALAVFWGLLRIKGETIQLSHLTNPAVIWRNVGDLIAVTGEIGEAGAGFFALEKELSNYKKQKESFLKPKPRIHESKNAIKTSPIFSTTATSPMLCTGDTAFSAHCSSFGGIVSGLTTLKLSAMGCNEFTR